MVKSQSVVTSLLIQTHMHAYDVLIDAGTSTKSVNYEVELKPRVAKTRRRRIAT